MKFRYTFKKSDKIITVNMLHNTMFVYDRYVKMGYIAIKREALVDNEFIEII